jgi:hypothetical protein
MRNAVVVIHGTCAGLDVHKQTVVVCIRHVDASGVVQKQTPHLRLASGLYLANYTTRLGEAAREQDRSAGIVLKSPDGVPLDQAVSGFA